MYDLFRKEMPQKVLLMYNYETTKTNREKLSRTYFELRSLDS